MNYSEAAQKYVCSKISELLCEQTDMTDDDRVLVLSEYMEVFKRSWEESLEAYKSEITMRDMLVKSQAEAPPSSELSNDEQHNNLDDDLEEAAIQYEAALLAAIKHRTKAEHLSQLLGASTRMQLVAATKKQVDLPLRAPLEFPSLPDCDSEALYRRLQHISSTALPDAAITVKKLTQRLSNLSTGLGSMTDANDHQNHS